MAATGSGIEAHDGAVLALAPDAREFGFVSAGDDGVLHRISATGALTELFSTGGKWIEQLATHAEPRAGLLACAAGKQVHLFDIAGVRLKTLPHPSTVTGPGVRCARQTAGRIALQRRLGLVHRIEIRQSARAGMERQPYRRRHASRRRGRGNGNAGKRSARLVSCRRPAPAHDRISRENESFGFTRNGKWLASSGADGIVLWPFFGGGPLGKPPVELAPIEGVLCTRVACHPKDELSPPVTPTAPWSWHKSAPSA
ncbi:MAG: hypothetical protein WDN04_22120 [Rhodospirillales bacterium]